MANVEHTTGFRHPIAWIIFVTWVISAVRIVLHLAVNRFFDSPEVTVLAFCSMGLAYFWSLGYTATLEGSILSIDSFWRHEEIDLHGSKASREGFPPLEAIIALGFMPRPSVEVDRARVFWCFQRQTLVIQSGKNRIQFGVKRGNSLADEIAGV